MVNVSNHLPWGVEKRLEFIEFRVFWFDGVNRRDIIEKFGVSVLQASTDLSRYQNAAQGNITYCRYKKKYIAADNFTPVFYTPRVEDYVELLKGNTKKERNRDETLSDFTPQMDSVPILQRRIDPYLLRSIVRAVHRKRAVEIHYQFMDDYNPGPIWHWISPHAFFHDGFRWYVRGFSHSRHKFQDFCISQIFDVRNDEIAAADGEEDRFWREHVEVILVPNPKLSPGQRSAVAVQFGMPEMRIFLPIRKAGLYYFKKWLRLDVAEALNRPHESPIIVENRDEFETALTEVSSFHPNP